MVSAFTHAPVSDPSTVEYRATLDPDDHGDQVAADSHAVLVPATADDSCAQLGLSGGSA